jgi:hypothetical protein
MTLEQGWWEQFDDRDTAPSLLDVVDHLLDKGCLIKGSLVLGLADVDLVQCEFSLLLGSVDRIQSFVGGS